MKPGDHIDTAIDLIIKQQPKLGRFFKMRVRAIAVRSMTMRCLGRGQGPSALPQEVHLMRARSSSSSTLPP